jgi:hypothetical protein
MPRSSLSHLPHEVETDEKKTQEALDRRSTALLLLTAATSSVDLMLLAAALDVEAELDELAGDDEKRQQKVADARAGAQARLDGWLQGQS